MVVLWYALLQSQATFVLVDYLFPRTKQVTAQAFPCAGHDCGCVTADQCAEACCCFPAVVRTPVDTCCGGEESTVPSSETIPISFLSELACSGGMPMEGLVVTGFDPAQLPYVDEVWYFKGVGFVFNQKGLAPLFIFYDVPDKVPIVCIPSLVV